MQVRDMVFLSIKLAKIRGKENFNASKTKGYGALTCC